LANGVEILPRQRRDLEWLLLLCANGTDDVVDEFAGVSATPLAQGSRCASTLAPGAKFYRLKK
jgi:hypothetical protein